jgi:hypothetical protein
MKSLFLPRTALGKWSNGLAAGLILFYVVAMLVVASGQPGGETYFSALAISIPMTLAGICGISAFFTGVISIIRSKERAILVFITTLIGLFVLAFIIGEFASPH